MGRILVKKVKGMSWIMKISLVLIFTMVFSTFMFQGWYKPKEIQAAITTLKAWTSAYSGAAFPTTYTVTKPAGSDRMMVVAVTSNRTTVGAQTCTVTYGTQTLTKAVTDETVATTQAHTWLFYLNEAGVAAASTTTLAVTVTGGTSEWNRVYYAFYGGVDQSASPLTSTQNYYNQTQDTAVGPFATALTIGTDDMAVEIVDITRVNSTFARTMTTWATGWTSELGPNSGGATNASSGYLATNTTAGTTTSQHTTNGTCTDSMSAMSIKAAPSLTVGDGTNPASANAPQSSTNNALDGFTLSINSGSGTVSTLTVTGSANFNATNIPTNGVKIYRDAGTIGTLDGADTLISSGSTAISGNATTVTLAGAETVTTTAANYLVTVDITAGATLSQTFTGTISGATGSGIGTPVDNDTTSATLTITGLTIGNGTNPANDNVTQSSTNNALDGFTLSINSGSGTVSTLTVTGSANFNATNIPTNGVKIYRDAGTIGTLDGADTLISSGSTAISGNATTVTLAGAETVTTTAANYLVTVDITAGATLSQTFTGTISGATGSGIGTPVDNDSGSATLIITAAPTGRIVYSNNSTTPQNREYAASSNTFGADRATIEGAAQTFMVDRAAATRNEHIAGYVTTAGVLYILRWNGTAWSNEWNVSVGGTGINGRRFDIAYEGISEDVIVVYSTNSTNPEMKYRVWNGSSWTAETNLDSARLTSAVNWVKIISRPGSDEIALAFSDTNRDLSSFIWNGSAWGNEPSSAHTTNLSSATTAGDYDTFDLAYESISGDLMVVWGDSTSTDPRYRTYSVGTWSATAEVTNQGSLPAHLDLASDPLSDRIILGYNVDAATRFFGSVWSGSIWSTARRLDSDTGQSSRTPTANHKEISVAFLNSGATRVGIVAFNNGSTTGRVDIAYTTNDGSSFAWNSFSPSPTPSYEAWMDIQVDPVSNDTMMLTFSDNNSDLFAKRLVINSTPTFTWTNADGGSALFNSLPNLTSKNFSFAYNRYPATVVGNGTNPSDASLCPGGTATMLDAFTLQTSLGTDTITNVTVTLAPTGSFNNIDLIEITNDAGSSVYGSATNPTADAVTITTTGLSATTTLTQYQVRITPKSHINMPVPPGASYAVTGTVTALTSTDIKIYSDITSATVTIDNLSPNNPTAFSGTPGSTKVSLSWTNPVDADFSQVVVLRKSVSAVTDKPSEGGSYIVGDTIGTSTVACVVNTPGTTCTDTGLTNGTAYYYKVFAEDSCGNYSSGGTAAGPYTPSAATVGNGTNPGNSFAGPSQTNKNADSFTLKTDTGACTATGLVVTGTNTANVAASGVKIYRDSGGTPNAWDATDTLITNGTASFSGNTATFTGLSISVTTSSVQYIVTYNIVASPTNGQTLTGTVTDITTTCDKMLSDTAGSTITIDAAGPTDGTLTASPASSTGINLSWTEATDSGSGLAAANTYKVVRATGAAAPADCTGTAIYQGTALLYNDTGLTPSTQYAYRVCAYDNVSNVSTGATATATTAAAGTAKTYYVNALSATNVGYDGNTNMPSLVDITVTGGSSNANRAYTNNTAPSGTTTGYRISEGVSNTRTNQEYFRAYTPTYASATSIEANATAYADFYMRSTGTSVTAKAFLYEYNDTTGVVGAAKGTASYTGNASITSRQTMNNVSFNNAAFTVTGGNRLMVIFAFTTSNSRPAYLWGQAASATPSGYQAITVKESTLIVPPVEVSGSLAVTPEYSAFVGSPFTITEDFTSTTTVNSCQYTINGGGLWSAGVVDGTGPYTCTASGVTAANGTALTIRMRASNDGGSTWSTVSASLSRTVDSAGPTNGTLTASPASSTQINLSWTAATDSGSGLAAANTYKVVRATGAAAPADCTGEAIYLGTELSYNDTGLTPSTQYSYRVCAYDNVSNVSTGATASATTLAPDNKTTIGAMTFPNVTSNWIQVQVAFTGDDNGNNSCVIKWGTSPGSYPNTAPAPSRSPSTGSGTYTTTVSGLSATTTYYFQATFSDGDTVSGTNPVLGSMITTPAASDADLLHNSNRFACSKQGYDTSATCTSAGGTWNPDRKWTGGWGSEGAKYGKFDCYTCHKRAVGNIKRIKPAITASSETFPGSNVAFTNTKGYLAGGFGNDAGGHSTSAKVCEVCHTKNMYHNYNTANNDPTPDFGLMHHNESDCVLCHPHNQGFRGVINTCITCHNKVQKPDAPYNVRRDVTSASGDLSKTSHHIVSATPDEGSCMICHKHAGNTDPAVKMLDPDAADTTIAYDGTAASLTPFCWNCHDSNGANRLAATGPTPAQKDYPLAIKTKPYADSGDNTAPPNVKTEYNKTYGHGSNGGIGTIGAECMDCHGDSAYDGTTLKPQKNAHGSGVKKMLNEPGTTYGLAMFSVCTNGSCHNTGDAFGVGDVEFEFRTTNQSYHPVRGALPATDPGANGSSRLAANQLAGGWCSKTGYYTSATCTAAGGTWTAWAPGATMTCVDCHNTDASPTAAQGPHGSSLKWMLAGVNKAWPYQGAANNGKSSGTYWKPGNMSTNKGTSNGLFCLNCHSLSGNKHSTLIAEDSDHDVACVQCHIRVPHGGKSSRFQADFGSTPMPDRYYPNGNGGGFTTGMIQIKKGDYTNKDNCYTNCGKHDSSIGGEEW